LRAGRYKHNPKISQYCKLITHASWIKRKGQSPFNSMN
jgi:hypothetical protein